MLTSLFKILQYVFYSLFRIIRDKLDNSHMGRAKQICYLSPMRAAKVQASLRIRAVSPEPPLLAHTSSESRGTFRQKARSIAPLNGWACAVEMCHDGMLEDTNSLDGAHITFIMLTLILIALDIEQNPGPPNISADLLILHKNLRSIRNKIDFIEDNFLDFNIMCFSETHLDPSISSHNLFLSDTHDDPYRRIGIF